VQTWSRERGTLPACFTSFGLGTHFLIQTRFPSRLATQRVLGLVLYAFRIYSRFCVSLFSEMFSTESPASTAIGAVGVALMLLAFLLNLFRVWRLERWPDSILYSFANFLGGALATAAAAMIFYWPFVVYEGIWCFFSAVNCVRLGWDKLQRRRAYTAEAKAAATRQSSSRSHSISNDGDGTERETIELVDTKQGTLNKTNESGAKSPALV
jgi:small-conductance mechanosensitive channel